MPPKSSNKKKAKKRKAKVTKAPRFTTEELNEEKDTFLNCFNPYMSQNCVEFDLKDKEFKQTVDFRKPIFYYRSIGASKQKLIGRYGVFYEEVTVNGEEKMNNKFNYCSVYSQTLAVDPKDKNEYIDPNLYPVLKFEGLATKETILKAYEEHERKKQPNKENEEKSDHWIQAELQELMKKIGRKGLTFQDECRKYLRLCERMLDQNLSEANLDFKYYDNPNDEFDPNVGSLLPLWKISFKDIQRMPVASLSWNALYQDLFVVGFRERGVDEEQDEDDLGLMRETGCMCVLSLKSPSQPEKILPCLWGVSTVAFHPSQHHLVAVGFVGGSLAIYNLKREANSPISEDSKFDKCLHVDLVGEVKWQQATLPHKFCSVSMDGQIINWLVLLNDLFPSDVIISLRLKEWPIEAPPKGLEMTLEPSKKMGENLGLNSCSTTLSVHPTEKEWFLVGMETGLIHRGSFDDKICNATYRDHKDAINSIHWNPLHPRVFLSCSKDYTIQIWDKDEKHSIFDFFFENEVKDVVWAPFSSTLFAVISGNAIVSVFDLAVNKLEAIGTFTCYTRKQDICLTRITFHPKMPVLMVGDDRGSVIVLKLSPNLRSSLKSLETIEKSFYVAGEIEKMEKLLTASKVRSSPVSSD